MVLLGAHSGIASFHPRPNVLMPCCHSGTILGSNRLDVASSRFISGTTIPNKNNKSAKFWLQLHCGMHCIIDACHVTVGFIHSNFGNLWLAWMEMIQWTHTTHDKLLKIRALINKCYRLVLTILKNDFLIFILCCDLFLPACHHSVAAILTQGAIATFAMTNPPRRQPLFYICGSFVRELAVTAMWS